MALKKPTITMCVDGKDHAWMIIAEENGHENGSFEHRWCQKCGVLTQIMVSTDGDAVALKGEDGGDYLVLPKVLAAVTK